MVDAGRTKTVQLVLANDSAARVEGCDSELFALPGQPPRSVQAGQVAILPISFTSTGQAEGGKRATLVIESNAANASQLRVDLFGMSAPPRRRPAGSNRH